LDAVLALRFGDDSNEFWMFGDEPFPALAVQVKGALACLHFFPKQSHPGFLSMGDGISADPETFFTNTPIEEIQVPADAVVPFELARRAAMEFLGTHVIPPSVRWNDLS
jgi:hypothetical protein